MNREALIRELRKLAREQGRVFEVFTNRGKGSHYRVRFGDRMTTIQSGELTKLHVRTIRKHWGRVTTRRHHDHGLHLRRAFPT